MHVEDNSSLSSEGKNVQSLQENVHSLAKAIKEVSSSILELSTSLYRLQEHFEALIKKIPIENQVEVRLLGENIKICDIKGNKKHSSANKDGTFQSTLSSHAASGICEPQFNRINQNVPLEQVEDVYEGNSPVKDYPFREIDIEIEEKIEIHETPVDSALTREESKRELQNITLNETSFSDDYTHEHSSDEVTDEVQFRSVASMIIWGIDHAATNQRQDGKFVSQSQSVLKKIDRFKECSITLQKEAPMTVDHKGVLEEVTKSIKMGNVRQRTDRTENLPMKTMPRSTEVDDLIISLPKEMGNVKSSREHDKGSSNTIQWYINWSDKRLPVRDYLYFVFAVPFVVSLRVIPLPPRRFFVQNNMYQYEYARLASFSTYEGRGFRILFAQAGFVFDPVTKMVVCPWCSVFVHDYDVSIRFIHLSDCMFLQINIPLHNAPRIPGRADTLLYFMEAGSANLSSALIQAQNSHSIEKLCSRIRSEQAATLPVTENEDVRLQENALMVSTEPRTCPNIHQASPAVFCCSHTRSNQSVGLNSYQGNLRESSSRFQSEQISSFPGSLRNRVRPHDSAKTVSTNPAICENDYQAAPRVSCTRIRPEQPDPLATSLKECVRSQDHVERVAPKANIGPNNHQTIPPVSYTRNRPKQTSTLPLTVKTGAMPYGDAVKKSIKSSIDLESYHTPRQVSCSRLRSEQTPTSPVTRNTNVRLEENPIRVSTKPLFRLNNHQARPLVSCSNIRPQKTPVVEKGLKSPDNRKRALTKPSVGRNSYQGKRRVFCSKNRSEQAPILSVAKKKDVRPQGNSPRVSTKPNVCGNSIQGSEKKSPSPVIQEKGVRPQENAMRGSTNPMISANCHQLATRVSCTRSRSTQTPASWMERTRVSCDENDHEAAEDAENKEADKISTLPDGTVGSAGASASCFCQEETLNYLLTEVTQVVQNVGDHPDVPVKHTLIGLREERREGGGKNPEEWAQL